MEPMIMVVYSQPFVGREKEYNDWYNSRHVADLLQVPGFLAAQRFEAADASSVPRYLLIAELSASDPATAIQRLKAANLHISEAVDRSKSSIAIFRPITARREAPKLRVAPK